MKMSGLKLSVYRSVSPTKYYTNIHYSCTVQAEAITSSTFRSIFILILQHLNTCTMYINKLVGGGGGGGGGVGNTPTVIALRVDSDFFKGTLSLK